jgi:hypothetical protein
MLKFVPLALVFATLFGFVVVWLWNWLMPELFGLREIGFWQAWGLILLSKILFGGFRGGPNYGGGWRHRMMERCERMTPDERERFRQAFESRWGRQAPADPTPAA